MPLAAFLPDGCDFRQEVDRQWLGHRLSSVEVVVVGNYFFCTMFYEVTHILDTQLQSFHDPVETGAPP